MKPTFNILLCALAFGIADGGEVEAIRNLDDPKELWVKVSGAIGCAASENRFEELAGGVLSSNGIEPLTGSTLWPYTMHLRIELDCIPVLLGMDSNGKAIGALAYAVNVTFARKSHEDYAQFPWNTLWAALPGYESIGKTELGNPKPIEDAVVRLTQQAMADYKKANFD